MNGISFFKYSPTTTYRSNLAHLPLQKKEVSNSGFLRQKSTIWFHLDIEGQWQDFGGIELAGKNPEEEPWFIWWLWTLWLNLFLEHFWYIFIGWSIMVLEHIPSGMMFKESKASTPYPTAMTRRLLQPFGISQCRCAVTSLGDFPIPWHSPRKSSSRGRERPNKKFSGLRGCWWLCRGRICRGWLHWRVPQSQKIIQNSMLAIGPWQDILKTSGVSSISREISCTKWMFSIRGLNTLQMTSPSACQPMRPTLVSCRPALIHTLLSVAFICALSN